MGKLSFSNREGNTALLELPSLSPTILRAGQRRIPRQAPSNEVVGIRYPCRSALPSQRFPEPIDNHPGPRDDRAVACFRLNVQRAAP